MDTEQFENLTGAVKGDLTQSLVDKSKNLSLYAEDSLFIQTNLALIAGVQYLHATRNRRDRIGTGSGRQSFDLWRPKFGLLWDVARMRVVYGRSGSARVD